MPLLAALLLSAQAAFAQPNLSDDLPLPTLEAAVGRSLAYYAGEGSSRTFSIEGRTLTAADMAATLKLFLATYKEASDEKTRAELLAERFRLVEATSSVLFTGYYEPVLDASLQKSAAYPIPLYARPPDLVEVDTEQFDPSRRGGRLWGRVVGGRLEPYFSREQIDFEGALAGKGLELAWVKDRWDALDAQIEGSAVLRLPDGTEKRALFDGTNGLPFKSPTRALVEAGLLPKERWSSQAARKFLDEHPEQVRPIFSADRRYAFFKLEPMGAGEGPLGTTKQPLTDGRSLAIDASVYPLGGLAYYEVDLPQPHGGSRHAARFALLQDTGGAILGPARADLYVGRGPEAFAVAGKLKAQGKLYLLIRK